MSEGGCELGGMIGRQAAVGYLVVFFWTCQPFGRPLPFLMMGLQRNVVIYTIYFSGMLASGKQLSNKKNEMKSQCWTCSQWLMSSYLFNFLFSCVLWLSVVFVPHFNLNYAEHSNNYYTQYRYPHKGNPASTSTETNCNHVMFMQSDK